MASCAQALSNTMWALSKLGYEDSALFSGVNRRVLATLPNFSVQNLANIVHLTAFGSNEHASWHAMRTP